MRHKKSGTLTGALLPAAVLCGIFAFCAGNGQAVGRKTERWEREVDVVSALARREQWQEADDTLSNSYQSWREARQFLQMFTRHDAEEEAESLYRRCLVEVRARSPEVTADLSGLRAYLENIAEMERLTWGNLL